MKKHFAAFILFLSLANVGIFAQSRPQTNISALYSVLDTAYQFRCIGPFRGGRSAAVTGVAGKPNLFYFGGTGGGVWRTQDGGRTWGNISDGYFGGSIGAIEVAASDQNVIYVGGGEVTVRGNVSAGSGMWRSEDAGRTWAQAGLSDSRHIPRIRVHPKDANTVYAAVLGDLYKPTKTRGIYRSKDGGRTWQQVKFVSEDAGAVDLCMDPNNPRILFASFWKIRRNPYSLSSGGDGSSLWKSTDGGDTWTDISRREGLPKDTLGIIGVTVSPQNSDRVWAIIESQTGGVFRSDNGGLTWAKVNSDRKLRQRAWYYTRIYADPADEDVVYVMNVSYHKSKDGGRTFESKNAPHGDHHDFWVAPEDPKRLIIGDDGGAQISYDGGTTWSTYHNQPTAQFYRVTTDNAFPFRIYAAQQDNSTIRIAHRSNGGSIDEHDWEETAGSESGHLAVDPLNNDIVYGGSYHGYLTRIDHKAKSERAINVWPVDNMGHGAEDAKYRFQWNYPIFFSRHNPHKLYCASNRLHVTSDEGQNWETISPDLTTNDRTKQKSSGGPITQDNTSVEYYCTIFAADESPIKEGVLWTGSDDGLVHITKNGGKDWQNVTPTQLPKWAQINSLEADPLHEGGCYIAATSYKSGDYKPYLFYTSDFGKTWKSINNGIAEEHFTRVVRADAKREGLLFAGTEAGLYVSFDNGNAWEPLQLNLPITPITDLTIKGNTLVIATQGRSLWIMDDLSPLREWKKDIANETAFLFNASPAYLMNGGGGEGSKTKGENHPGGVPLFFYLKNTPSEKDTVTLALLTEKGDTIKVFSNKNDKKDVLSLRKGGNRFVWDMRYPDAEKFDGMVLWSYGLEGPRAVPGNYRVRMTAFGKTTERPITLLADPRKKTSLEEYQEQFAFVQSVGNKITELHKSIRQIRQMRGQMNAWKANMPKTAGYKPIFEYMAQVDSSMTLVEKAIYQTQNQSSQDPLNFPVQLNDKLANLMGLNVVGEFRPTQQSLEVRDLLFKEADALLQKWKEIQIKDIPALNRMIREQNVDIFRVKGE